MAQIKNAEISFVSLVDKPANKRNFLIKKNDGAEASKEELQELDAFFKAYVGQEVNNALAPYVEAFKAQGIELDVSTGDKVKKSEEPHYLHGIL